MAAASYRDIDVSSRPKASQRARGDDDGGLGYEEDGFVVEDEEGREGEYEVGMDDDDD